MFEVDLIEAHFSLKVHSFHVFLSWPAEAFPFGGVTECWELLEF